MKNALRLYLVTISIILGYSVVAVAPPPPDTVKEVEFLAGAQHYDVPRGTSWNDHFCKKGGKPLVNDGEEVKTYHPYEAKLVVENEGEAQQVMKDLAVKMCNYLRGGNATVTNTNGNITVSLRPGVRAQGAKGGPPISLKNLVYRFSRERQLRGIGYSKSRTGGFAHLYPYFE
jgi:hypothetical protein